MFNVCPTPIGLGASARYASSAICQGGECALVVGTIDVEAAIDNMNNVAIIKAVICFLKFFIHFFFLSF
jgi:hypothetical protein